MASSEGVKRLLALIVVAAGVVAQTSVTRGVAAEQRAESDRFGVRLLDGELAPPVFLATSRNGSTHQLGTRAKGSASSLPASLPAPGVKAPGAISQRLQMALPWADSAAAPASVLLDPFPNRDSVGALVTLTRRDVLLLTRQAFPPAPGSFSSAPTAGL